MELVCKRCSEKWESGVENPKQCRICKSPYWNVERKRAPGAGRKSVAPSEPKKIEAEPSPVPVRPLQADKPTGRVRQVKPKFERAGAEDQKLVPNPEDW